MLGQKPFARRPPDVAHRIVHRKVHQHRSDLLAATLAESAGAADATPVATRFRLADQLVDRSHLEKGVGDVCRDIPLQVEARPAQHETDRAVAVFRSRAGHGRGQLLLGRHERGREERRRSFESLAIQPALAIAPEMVNEDDEREQDRDREQHQHSDRNEENPLPREHIRRRYEIDFAHVTLPSAA